MNDKKKYSRRFMNQCYKKMGLSEKFPRDVLCVRKLALGVRLTSPITIMNALALKLHAEHNIIEGEVSKTIKINEENARFHYGFAAGAIDATIEWQPNIGICSDEIRSMLKSRKLTFVNRLNENKWITKHKMIMDYALQYSKEQKVIEAINHIRLFKKMISLCELVGFKGRKVTREMRECQE